MVEYTISLDNIFHSLADETRRDILRRVAKKKLSVGQIAKHYGMTFAGISKHLQVLEKARLISKHKQGKEHIVSIHPVAFKNASEYISQYQKIWEGRLDRLGVLLVASTATRRRGGKGGVMADKIVTTSEVHQVPADLRKAITTSNKAREIWNDITPLARSEWVCWVISGKKEETRGIRIKKAISKLKSGMRRPCCWMGCPHRTKNKK